MPYTSFLVNESEREAAVEVSKVTFDYFFLKEACLSNGKHMADLKTFCGLSLQIPNVQPANVVYLSVVDMHADTREAVVSKLHSEYEIGVTANSLVVVGDQKTYNRIQELKQVYSGHLKWLIPFIGDWHLLHNFHSVLMKVYYEAGLKDLAKASGFQGETLASLQQCSNFKRVHHFCNRGKLYIGICYKHSSLGRTRNTIVTFCLQHMLSYVNVIKHVNRKSHPSHCMPTYNKWNLKIQIFLQFQDWVKKLAENDPNWKFWMNFVFRDLFSHVTLFLCIRGGMWKLRLYGVKQPLYLQPLIDHIKSYFPVIYMRC